MTHLSIISSLPAVPALLPSRTTRSIFLKTMSNRRRYEAFAKKIKDLTEFVIDVMKIPPEDFNLKEGV